MANSDEIVQILVVIGAINDEDDVKYVLASIKAGILRWSQKLNVLPAVDECLLGLEASHDSVADEEGLAPYFRFVHVHGNTTVAVIVSPSCFTVNQEIAELLMSRCDRRLVVYGGHTINSQPNWCFKDGVFAVEDLLYVLTDPNIVATLQRANIHPTLTISCCKASGWKLKEKIESSVKIEVIDPFHSKPPDCEGERSPITKGMNRFTGKLEELLADQTQGIFTQLEPPVHEGFLKLRNPCIYIFPSGNGDSSFFTVNGFNVLINGGALARPWFWRLIRHQDRVDCIIATHLGNDCLAGINSFLLRKLQERQIRLPMDSASPEYKSLARCLLSPDLGVFFMNAPRKFTEMATRKGSESVYDDGENEDHTIFQQLNVKPTDTVQQTLRLSKSLGLEVNPLTRSGTPEPFTLFSKYGIGKLDLYVINPDEGSKELMYIHEKWGCDGKSINQTTKTGIKLASGKEGESLVSDLASICCLLVWHPFSPNEKILRVLFPGNAPQDKLFEGLEKLKHLEFLSTPFPTQSKLTKSKVSAKTMKPTTAKTKSFAPKPASTSSGKVTHHSSQSATTVAKSTHTSSTSRATASKSATTMAAKSSQQVTSRAAIPLLGKIQTAASRPEKKTTIGATKKTMGAARKQPVASKIESTSKTKRDGNNLVKSAEKRTKSDKLPAAKAATSKPKPGPVHAKAEARVKAKHVTDKATARANAGSKETGKATAKSTVAKAPLNVKITKKQNATSTSKIDTTSPGKANDSLQQKKNVSNVRSSPKTSSPLRSSPKASRSLRSIPKASSPLPSSPKASSPLRSSPKASSPLRSSPKTSSPLSKAKTPLTPPEDLTAAFSNLAVEDTSAPDKDKTAELWKRQSPEGQDEGAQEHFVEGNENVVDDVALEKGDMSSIEKIDQDCKEPNNAVESRKPLESEKEILSKFDEAFQGAADDSSVKRDAEKQDENKSPDLSQTRPISDDSEDGNASSDLKICDEQNLEIPSESFINDQPSDVRIIPSLEPPAEEGSHVDHPAVETEEDRQHAARKISDDFTGEEVIEDRDAVSTKDDDVTENLEGGDQKVYDDTMVEELKENIDPETHTVDSDHHFDDDNDTQDENASSGHNVHLEDTPDVETSPVSYEYSNKENVDPVDLLSDQLADATTSPLPSPSSHSATAEAAVDLVLEENQEYLEVEDRGRSAESATEDVALSVESSTPFDQVEEKKTPQLQAIDDSQFDYVDKAHDDEHLEKEEIPLSDPPCSYSTTSTMSKRALLESPCSTELDSTYNIPSTLGSVSIAASAVEPENEQTASQPVSDFYDDNGNRANDVWKSGISNLNAQYPISPIVAWSDGKESNDQILEDAASEDPSEHEEIMQQGSDKEFVSLDTGVDVGASQAHGDEPDIFSVCDTGKKLSSSMEEEQEVGVIQDASVVPESPEIHQGDVAEIGLEKSPFSPVLPQALSSPTLEQQLSDPHDSSQVDALISSSEEEPDQSSFEHQRHEEPIAVVLRNDHDLSEESSIDQSHITDEPQNGISYSSDYHFDSFNSCQYHYESEPVPVYLQNGTATSSEELPSAREHDGGSSDAPSSVEFNNDLRQLHAGQSSVSELSSYEYDVTNDQKATLIRLSDKMYSDHVEKNPAFDSPADNTQETVKSEGNDVHYMDVANRSKENDFSIFDDALKSEGALSTGEAEETSPNENEKKLLDFDSSMTGQARDNESGQSSPFDPFQNQFVDKLAEDDEWLKQDSSFSPLDQAVGHEGTYTFGANNPFVADLGQSLPQEREEDDFAPIRTQDPMMPQDRPTSSKTKKSAATASGSKKSDPPAFYFDLAYIPHHVNKNHCGVEFFKRIRSKYYVISGFDACNDEPSEEALLGLLEGKMTWGNTSGSSEDCADATVIPTHNSAALHDWYEKHHRELDAENIHLVASGSKVLMHNESIEACKIEF